MTPTRPVWTPGVVNRGFCILSFSCRRQKPSGNNYAAGSTRLGATTPSPANFHREIACSTSHEDRKSSIRKIVDQGFKVSIDGLHGVT
jgi:hypothetical protein